MGAHVLSIIIAFLAYSMLDLGKAFQKVGLAAMSRSRARGIGIWFSASIATSASSFLILYAVSLGSVLIVGSMAGTGLAAVTLLAVFALLILIFRMRAKMPGILLAGGAAVFIVVRVLSG